MGKVNRRKRVQAAVDRGSAQYYPPTTATNGNRSSSRAALLGGASFAALAAFGTPGSAQACSGTGQTVNTLVTGPVYGTGGSIAVGNVGAITGGSYGVFAENCSIQTLTNNGFINATPNGAFGGTAVLNLQTIGALENETTGTIVSGSSAYAVHNVGIVQALTNKGNISGGTGVLGGSGVFNDFDGTIVALSNSGTIGGGPSNYLGGNGVINQGIIQSIANNTGGTIGGGPSAAHGGAGVWNVADSGFVSTIGLLSNSAGATVSGGAGYSGAAGKNGGSGGVGVYNAGPTGNFIVTLPMITTLSNSGSILGGAGGTGAAGGAGAAGVENGGTISTLSNSRKINGGAGGAGVTANGDGGAGVLNDKGATITSFDNQANATTTGGAGGSEGRGGAGGAGVANAGTIGSATTGFSNEGTIQGGAGGSTGGAGGAGVSNSGSITTLTNKGHITGGAGGSSAAGGAAVAVGRTGSIAALTNSGSILGGSGGRGITGASGAAGLYIAGKITTLTNAGTIMGGGGGQGSYGLGGNGGDGIFLEAAGSIQTLSNKAGGLVAGGAASFGDSGYGEGGAGINNEGAIGTINNAGIIDNGVYAILSTGSIGLIVNSGEVIGNVEIENHRSLTGDGGDGRQFGLWTGGAIDIREGDLTFGGGATALADNVTVDRGGGTVYLGALDPVRIDTAVTITGNFDERPNGGLDFLVDGVGPGQYGTLGVTGSTILGGFLGLDTARGVRFSAGETFDLISSADGFYEDIEGLTFDGAACSATAGADRWLCSGAGLYFNLSGVEGGLLTLTTSSVPEPSTWAMLGVGFGGLGWLTRQRKRKLTRV
jgi:hypothetical protein